MYQANSWYDNKRPFMEPASEITASFEVGPIIIGTSRRLLEFYKEFDMTQSALPGDSSSGTTFSFPKEPHVLDIHMRSVSAFRAKLPLFYLPRRVRSRQRQEFTSFGAQTGRSSLSRFLTPAPSSNNCSTCPWSCK